MAHTGTGAGGRFLLILVASAFGSFVFLLIAVYVVNPHGFFDTRYVEPLVLTNRTEKIAALKNSAPRPEAVILGSSRVFELDPEQLEEKTGLHTYNAGVSYARPEEWLALTRLMVERLGITPRLLVIGVNVGELNHDTIDVQTITNPDLRPYLPISRKDIARAVVSTMKQRLNPGLVIDVANALLFRFTGGLPERTTFLANGRQDTNAAYGEKRDLDAITESVPAAAALFAGVDQLSPARLAYTRDLATFAAAHHIEVVVLVLPMAQAADAALADTQYAALKDQLLATLEQISASTPTFRVFDATTLPRTNDVVDFNDATHPSGAFLRRIMDAAFATP